MIKTGCVPTNEDMDKFLDGLDADLMKKTAEYAHKQYLEGKCIPHSEVMSRIMDSDRLEVK